MDNKGLQRNVAIQKSQSDTTSIDSIVLDKTIFSNVFEKDIRRVYIYKKAERLAKAIQLILPAFKDAISIKDRLGTIAIALIDAGVLAPAVAREHLSRELLTLASVLSVARAGGMLSPMNAEIISREAHNLLQEVAGYDDQKVSFEEMPTLASLARSAHEGQKRPQNAITKVTINGTVSKGHTNGHSYQGHKNGRGDSIVSILKTKGPSRIKDISMLVREVSEKTIQRELQILIQKGEVKKAGERRWTTYTYIGRTATDISTEESKS